MNANENPFRSVRVERIRYELSREKLGLLADEAIRLRVSCLLGPHGSGKTTLLEDLEDSFKQSKQRVEWIRLNQESSADSREAAIEKLTEYDPKTICLFDGAEVLSWFQWRSICSSAKRNGYTLIATLHKRRSTTVLHRTETSWELTEQFVRQLAGKHASRNLIAHAKNAFDANKGNMRAVFRACYLYLADG